MKDRKAAIYLTVPEDMIKNIDRLAVALNLTREEIVFLALKAGFSQDKPGRPESGLRPAGLPSGDTFSH